MFPSVSYRRRQRGGMTILLALVLLSIMSVAALGIANTSIRELTTTGTVLQGGKAAEAADAGLDWAIVWSDKANREAVAGSTKSSGFFAEALNAVLVDSSETIQSEGISRLGDLSDRAVRMASLASAGGTSGMVFNTADSLVAQGSTGGNRVIQKFDLDIRYLGSEGQLSGTTGGGAASADTDTASKSQTEHMVLVSAFGTANVDLGDGTYVSYRQRRDLINKIPPTQ